MNRLQNATCGVQKERVVCNYLTIYRTQILFIGHIRHTVHKRSFNTQPLTMLTPHTQTFTHDTTLYEIASNKNHYLNYCCAHHIILFLPFFLICSVGILFFVFFLLCHGHHGVVFFVFFFLCHRHHCTNTVFQSGLCYSIFGMCG